MPYITPTQLADGPDMLNELSELFGVEPALLKAAIAGEDISDWPEGEPLVAVDALATIGQRILQAGGEIDARLGRRGYPLPQDPVQFPILTVWARAIARYHLHPQREGTQETTGRIERDYRDAIRALDLVADGKLSLGAGDPLATDPAAPEGGRVRIAGNDRLFSRKSLGSL